MKRDKSLVVRISKEEEQKIIKEAEKTGLNKSTYVRVKILEIINAKN